MLTKDAIQAEANELRDQLGKAQQQLYASQQQTESLNSTVERLQGAIIITEKFLAHFDSPPQAPGAAAQSHAATPNGVQQSPTVSAV